MKDELRAKAISDDDLDGVSGGYLFDASRVEGSDPDRPWEVIDSRNGGVIRRFSNRRDAEDYAWDIGERMEEVGWGDVQRLRRRF